MFSKSDPRLVLIQEYAPHMLGTYQDIKNYQEALFDKYKKQDNTSEMAAVYDVETKENNSQNLYQSLWNAADILRGKMDANEYKSYLLGLIFYKHLSDKLLLEVCDDLDEPFESLAQAQALYEASLADEDLRDDLLEDLSDVLGYTMAPQLTFTALVSKVYTSDFQLEDLAQGFRDIEQSNEIFENLFEDIDLYSKRLGPTPQKQNQVISELIKELNELNLSDHDGDILGDAYEYLIGQFASDSGKKAGEFYTPQAVSHLMTQIVFLGREHQKGMTLYDSKTITMIQIQTADKRLKSGVLEQVA